MRLTKILKTFKSYEGKIQIMTQMLFKIMKLVFIDHHQSKFYVKMLKMTNGTRLDSFTTFQKPTTLGRWNKDKNNRVNKFIHFDREYC